MSNLEAFFEVSPYGLNKGEKRALLNKRLLELTKHHYANCESYHKMIDCLDCNIDAINAYEAIPFLPVRLFKELDLLSINQHDVFKTMTSSGTTGQAVSKIYLDKENAGIQQKALVKIVSDYIGIKRLPMLIIDCPSVVKDRKLFSARGAGILGFSIFGTDRTYALDDDMKLEWNKICSFLEKHKGQTILMFGFTFMIWQHFYRELCRIKSETGDKLDLSDAVLIHGGGWKKLQNEAVSQEMFRQSLADICGIECIHDYYGMVEQTGCVYMQCEKGHLHASNFSDILIRDKNTLELCKNGEEGIIQVVSALPESYPGHSLLTEDLGVIIGEDDCPCGRKGKYFHINGRLQNAEIRGCSDTYADKFVR